MKASSTVRGVVPSTYVGLLFEYLQARGVDAPALLGEAAPDPGDRGLGRYPVSRWQRLLDVAAAHLNDPMLGLHLGQTITPAHWGVMGYVFMACANLGAALNRMEQYQRLLYDVNPLRYSVVGDGVELHWGVEHGRPGPLADECAITALVQMVRHITGKPLSLRQVSFVNAAPVDTQAYLRFFGCPVRFEQAETVLQFPVALLATTLSKPDLALVRVLEQQADALLAELPDMDDFEQAVRRSIAYVAREGEASLDRVANELHTSARTLRRRLEDRGKPFRELRDDTLRRMAESHLADPRLTLPEIAQLLGYSEQSAFTRAYTRWTGESPGVSRRRLQAM